MSIDERLLAIERRLAALEARFARTASPPADGVPLPSGAAPEMAQRVAPGADAAPRTVRPPVISPGPASTSGGGTAALHPQFRAEPPAADAGPRPEGLSIGLVLGWTGAAALVLAAAYLIRLGIQSGWLTPARQVGGAALLGLSMLVTGLLLRSSDRRYSSLLGAGGVAVLYLTVFGAHLYHHLIGPALATGLVVTIAALSLLLHAVFREPLYVAFALLGSYACPLLVPSAGADALDLAIYLTVWNAVYCTYALWIARRVVYVAALYGSLLIFDALWRGTFGGAGWEVAATFQLVQFLLFLAAIALFSLRVGRELSPAEAWAHFPALLLFYGVEYAILDQNAPAAAPAAAVAFAAFLYAVYAAVRRRLRGEALPSLALVNAFGALVLFHAVHLDAMSSFGWRPLFALLVAATLAATLRPASRRIFALWPYGLAGVLLFAAGYVELVFEWGRGEDPLEVPLALLYPAVLYAAYFRVAAGAQLMRRPVLLALGHLQLLVACGLLIYRLVPDESAGGRLWLSLAWAAVGTLALIVARLRRDRLLARSSLGIYALFAAKVLLFDLSEAASLVRVGCLAVLGISLYAGGWIYGRVLGQPVDVQPAGPGPAL